MSEYVGKEIVSLLRRNKKGKIIVSQDIEVRCTRCHTVKKINYWGHAHNRKKQIKRNQITPYLCHRCCSSDIMRNRNNECTGKTFVELYGTERALEIKSKLSIIAKNNKNPLWINPPKLRGDMHPWHGKTYEQLFGKENAQIRRTQCASIGEKNAQYGKPAYGGSGNGWSGWYKEWYFRSIMELSFMINYIEKNNLKWKTAEHKQYAIPYIHYNGHIRNYFADFLIEDKLLVEVKPHKLSNTPLVTLKKEAAEVWCKSQGLKYKMFTNKEFEILKKEDIIKKYTSKEIVWLPRYQQKFEEMYYAH